MMTEDGGANQQLHAMPGFLSGRVGDGEPDPSPDLDRARPLAVGAPVEDRRDRYSARASMLSSGSRPLKVLLVSMTSRCASGPARSRDAPRRPLPYPARGASRSLREGLLAGSWQSDHSNAFRLGDQRSPSLKFVAGAGFEPATSGTDRAIRSDLEDRESPRIYAERPRGPLRSVTEPHGSWRSVSGRFWPRFESDVVANAPDRPHDAVRVLAEPSGPHVEVASERRSALACACADVCLCAITPRYC